MSQSPGSMSDELSAALAMVAHDLRHPLQVIAASLGLLGRSDLAEEKRTRYVGTVRRAVDQLNRLIGDLDLVAEVGQNRRRLDPAPTDLTGLLRSALEDHARLAGEAQTRVRVSACEALSAVHADPRATARVVSRLADLALKRVPESATATVAAFDDGDAVALRTDVKGLRRQSTELTLIERLVTAQGGTVTLEDGADEITQITLRLPRAL